jgi:uncharacterized protein YneF (UPF0154 family)
MPRSNVPSALIASLLIGVGLCAGFLIGHFSQGRYTNAIALKVAVNTVTS